MGNDEIYAITNIKGYALEMRQAAAESIVDNVDENLDDYININQMINLVKSECIGYDDLNRPLLNEDANAKIYESTITWIHNVGLARLAAKGLIECAWDNNSNEMIFWANKTINSDLMIEQMEKRPNDKPIKRRNKKKDKGS